jgi:hypothetical protein
MRKQIKNLVCIRGSTARALKVTCIHAGQAQRVPREKPSELGPNGLLALESKLSLLLIHNMINSL